MSNPSNGLHSPQSSLVTQIFQIHSSPFGRDRMCCGLHMGPQLSGPKMILKVKLCKDQELKQSETKSSPQNQNGKYIKLQIVKIQREHNHGQPSEQLQVFPKKWPFSNPNRTKNNMSKRKVKRHRSSDTKNRQQRTTTKLPVGNELLCCCPSQMPRKR